MKWIDIKEQLPPVGKYVLVYLVDGVTKEFSRYFVDRIDDVCEFEYHYIHNVITHWLPIPLMEDKDNE